MLQNDKSENTMDNFKALIQFYQGEPETCSPKQVGAALGVNVHARVSPIMSSHVGISLTIKFDLTLHAHM